MAGEQHKMPNTDKFQTTGYSKSMKGINFKGANTNSNVEGNSNLTPEEVYERSNRNNMIGAMVFFGLIGLAFLWFIITAIF